MITVLIRTSFRPLQFARAINSVPPECRVIVSYDNDKALSYIPKELQTIKVEKSDLPYFYDLYCNSLKELVTDGYFIFLDDDDVIITLDVPLLEDHANIVQLQRRNTVRPIDANFKAGQIGMPCLILHSKYKHLADIPGTGQGDYHWIKSVCAQLPINFVPTVVVGSDTRGFGRPEAHI
jgi:hypothetical protein